MEFEIVSKNKDGDIVFEGTASEKEASFLFTVGISYLLSMGVAPMLRNAKFEGTVLDEPPLSQ